MSLQDAVKALKLMKADLEETRKQRASLEAEVENKDATLTALQSKVAALTMELQFYTSMAPQGQDHPPPPPRPPPSLEQEEMAKRLAEVEREKASLIADKKLLVRHCRKAESDLAEKEKELGALRAATASTGPAPPTTTDHSDSEVIQALEQEKASLLADRKVLKAHIKTMEQQMEELRIANTTLPTEIQSFNDRIGELERLREDDLRQADVKANNEKKVLQSQIRRLESQLEDRQADFNKRIGPLQEEIKSLQGQLEASEVQRQQLQDDLLCKATSLEEEKNSMKIEAKEKLSALAEVNALKEALQAMEKNKEDCLALQEEQYHQLLEEKEALARRANEMEAEKDRLCQDQERALTDELERLNQEVAAHDKEKDHIVSSLQADAEAVKARIAALECEGESLRQQLRSKEAELDSSVAALDEVEKLRTSHRTVTEEKEIELEELRGKWQAAEKARAATEERMGSVVKSLEEVQARLKEVELHKDEEVAKSQSSVESLQEGMGRLHAEKVDLQKCIKCLEVERTACQMEVTNWRSQVQNMNSQLQEKDDFLKSLQTALDQLRKDKDGLLSEYEALKARLEAMNQEQEGQQRQWQQEREQLLRCSRTTANDYEALQRLLEEKDALLESCRSEIDGLKSQFQEAGENNRTRCAEVQNLTEEREKILEELGKERSTAAHYQDQVASLTKEKEDLVVEIQRLASELDGLQKEKQSLLVDRKVLKAHVRKMEQRASECQVLQAEGEESWKSRYEELERERDMMAQERNALQQTNKNLEDQLEALSMKYDEANKDRQIPEEATVLGMKQQDKELGLVEDEASRDKAQLVDEQAEVQFLKREDRATEALGETRKLLRGESLEIDRLRLELAAAQEDYRRLNLDLKDAERGYVRDLRDREDEMEQLKISFRNLISQHLAQQQAKSPGGTSPPATDEMRNLVTSLTLQVGELQAKLEMTQDRLRESRTEGISDNGSREDSTSTIYSNGVFKGQDLIQDLQDQLQQTEREAESLRDRVKLLEGELATVTAPNCPAEGMNMLELSQTLIDAEARAKQLEGQLADTRLEMEKLKGDMAKLQDERDRYRSQVEAQQDNQKQTEDLSTRLEQMEREFEERIAQAAASTKEEADTLVASMKHSLQEYEVRGQQTMTELLRLKESYEAVEAERDALQNRVEDMIKDVNHLLPFKQALEKLQADRDSLHDVKEEQNLARQERSTQLNRLAEEVALLKQELLEMRTERDALSRHVETFDGKVQMEMTKVLQGVEAERDELKRQLEEKSDLDDYKASLESTLKALEKEREVLQQEVNRLLHLLNKGKEEGMHHEDSTDIDQEPITGGVVASKTRRLGAHVNDPQPVQRVDEHNDKVGSLQSPGSFAANALMMGSKKPSFSEWKEETEVNPLPPFGLSSPVVEHLLHSWTSDKSKLDYLKLWLKYLIDEKRVSLPPNFTSGIQLINLQPEVKDGFLTLIVPMLQHRSDLEVSIHSRESPNEAGAYDLRIKILNLTKLAASPASSSLPPSSPNPPSNTSTPKKRLLSSSSTSALFESFGFGLALASPSRTSTPASTDIPSPSSNDISGKAQHDTSSGATVTGSPTGTSIGRMTNSSESSPTTPGTERRSKKGVLASRIEERLALLQQQQQQRPPSS